MNSGPVQPGDKLSKDETRTLVRNLGEIASELCMRPEGQGETLPSSADAVLLLTERERQAWHYE